MAVAMRQGRVGAQILGSDGWSSNEVRRFAQEAAVGAVFTDAFTYASPRAEVETFVTAFRERHRAQPGTFAALGYDAARWVLRAALRPAQLDAVSLRDALLSQRLDDAVCAPLSVGARRELRRAVHVLRHERDGVVLAATELP
jgi:branched-chain amino acid transport system substrate-binding protein